MTDQQNLMSKTTSVFSGQSQRFLQRGIAGGGVTSSSQPSAVQQPPLLQQSAVITQSASVFTPSTAQQLDVLDQVLDEVDDSAMGMISQAVPQVIAQLDATQQAASGQVAAARSGLKEQQAITTPDQAMVDAAAGLVQVEIEPELPAPEITPEVEAFLQEVKDQEQLPPTEVVLADGSQDIPVPTQYPSKPVIVIPITPDTEKKARFKSPEFSIRWLVEWSKKIMKMFKGTVIYRQVERQAA